jgi:hypothetical protein
MSGVSSPSFASPVSVAPFPTYAPSFLPSAAPSVEDFDFVEGSLVTQMYINEERTMSTIENELFVGLVIFISIVLPLAKLNRLVGRHS